MQENVNKMAKVGLITRAIMTVTGVLAMIFIVVFAAAVITLVLMMGVVTVCTIFNLQPPYIIITALTQMGNMAVITVLAIRRWQKGNKLLKAQAQVPVSEQTAPQSPAPAQGPVQ